MPHAYNEHQKGLETILAKIAWLEAEVRRLSSLGGSSAGSGGGGTTVHANEMHDPDMALATHNHDADYSDVSHDHDSDYAATGHAHTFLALSDTPSAYTGQAGKYAKVKGDESGLEFAVAAGAVTKEAVFTFDGTLTTTSWPRKFRNQSGATRTITKVALGADVGPTGAAVIVDIHKNGTTIFTNQANRPQIAAGADSGNTTTIDVPAWGAGEYLTIDIDQVGSTVAGEDLIVHLFYTE
jgi:hypothetical protein